MIFSVISIILIVIVGASAENNMPLALSSFRFQPIPPQPPRLVLVTGCTGAGKSTFGMNVALSEGTVKCLSTDRIREVQRIYDKNPALHRSSYVGSGDPVEDWLEATHAMDKSIYAMVSDAINRGQSLVFEGIHIRPDNELINLWKAQGGSATGVLLTVSDELQHKDILDKRRVELPFNSQSKLDAFRRIRAIQKGMEEIAKESGWKIIETTFEDY